ncbi:hypothetical protein [Actinokineospora enzanensis]|uniref:hypothetical protein n=1 Tax=Actinokineospora enzanensis TaxID=155975 RepID=UPI00036FA6E9
MAFSQPSPSTGPADHSDGRAPVPADRRAGGDACPGALDTHQAADGGLARVRVPGGRLRADQLHALADLADEFGDGALELTSRANVQLRGLAPGVEAELADRLAAAGLLPSRPHEKVRNIIASPLGRADLVAGLDAALCAAPELAALPGRFLFAVDDGSGDVAWLGADVTAVPLADPRPADAAVRTDSAVGTATAVPTGAGLSPSSVSSGRPESRCHHEKPGPRDTDAANITPPPSARSRSPRDPAVPLDLPGAATPLDPDVSSLLNSTPVNGAVPDHASDPTMPGHAAEATAHLSSPARHTNDPLPGSDAARPADHRRDHVVPQRGRVADPTGPPRENPRKSPIPQAISPGIPVGIPGTVSTVVRPTPSLSGSSDSPVAERRGVDSSSAPHHSGQCGPRYAVLLAGIDHGIRLAHCDLVSGLLACARAFLELREDEWRMVELGPRAAAVAARVGTTGERLVPGRARAAGSPGPVVFADGVPGYGATVPLGRLTAAQARTLGDVIVTPWRGIVVRGDGAGLAAAGLLTDPGAPGIGVTACAGKPGCAKALADVRSLALTVRTPGRAVHWSGCGRRCGRPAGDVLDVVATEDGYLVDGRAVPGERVATAVALGRQERG